MRYHQRFPAYALHHDAERLRALIRAENLCFARAEPTWSNRHEAELDLVFKSDGAYATIAFAIVDGVMLLERESDPIVWPGWMRGVIDEAVSEGVSDYLFPWLRSRVLSRFENAEFSRTFRSDPATSADIDRARAAGLLGAATLGTVMRSIAAASYAIRFAQRGSVLVAGPDGANGAALLAGRFAHVAYAPADGEDFEFTKRWFSTSAIARHDVARSYEVYVGERARDVASNVRIFSSPASDGEWPVEIAQPLPLGVLVSFDPEDSAKIGEIAVSIKTRDTALERESRLAAPTPVGGSTGRIALLVRDDCLRIEDADTDAARALERALRGEGFDVSIYGAGQPLHPERVDLVHVIGHRHAEAVRGTLEALRAAGKPVVLMPYLDDREAALLWGMSTTASALRESTDEAVFTQYFDALAVRRLVADAPTPVTGRYQKVDDDVQALFDLAGAVIVCSDEESVVVRERTGYTGAIAVVPALVYPQRSESVEAIVGFPEYVLFHGPLAPRTHLLSGGIAAQAEGLPTIVIGSVASADYYLQVTARSGDRVLYLNEKILDAAQISGIYARARVFADVSWAGMGLHRMARAGSGGSTLVGSSAGYAGGVWRDLVELADPADLASMRGGIRRAWDTAPVRSHATIAATGAICEQQAALVQVVTAYQAASSRTLP